MNRVMPHLAGLLLTWPSWSSAQTLFEETLEAEPTRWKVEVLRQAELKYQPASRTLDLIVGSNPAHVRCLTTEAVEAIEPPYRVTLDFVNHGSLPTIGVRLWAQRQPDGKHYRVGGYVGGDRRVDWYWSGGDLPKKTEQKYQGRLEENVWYTMVLDVRQDEESVVLAWWIQHRATERVVVPLRRMVDRGERRLRGNTGYGFEASIGEPRMSRPLSVGAFRVTRLSDAPAPVAAERKAQMAPNSLCEPIVAIGELPDRPTIDGQISPDEWANATALDGLEMLDLGTAPRERTRAWIGYDREGLYLAVRCWMRPGAEPRSAVTERDGTVFTDDCIEIFVSPDRGTSEYHFVGNSIGTQLDERSLQSTWNGAWRYAARRIGDGWEAEMAIPFSDFDSPPPTEGSAWGLLIGRTVQNPTMQFSQWGSAQTTWHNPKTYGTIIFAGAPPRIELTDVQARGTEIRVAAAATNPRDRTEKIGFQARLLQRKQRDSSAEDQAQVLVFEEQRDLVLDTVGRTLDLPARGTIALPLPKLPDQSGSYILALSAEDATGRPLLHQRVPLDRVKPVEITVRTFPVAGVLEVLAEVREETVERDMARLACRLTGAAGETIWEEQIDATAQPFRFRDYGKLAEGEFRLRMSVLNAKEKVIGVDSIPLTKSPTPPWLGCGLGEADTVIPPWPPVRVRDRDTVVVWGREYVFGPNGLPRRIVTQGQELLAGPVTLTGQIDGKPIELVLQADERLSIQRTDTKAIVTATSRVGPAPNVRVRVQTTVEFDGFVWVELRFLGTGRVDRLALNVPLRKSLARYRLPVFNESVAVPEGGLSAPLHAKNNWATQTAEGLHWVGSEDIGLALAAEDGRGWNLADESKALELLPGDDAMLWRVNLVDAPCELGGEREMALCWLATPARPVDKWYAHRPVGDGWYPSKKEPAAAIKRAQRLAEQAAKKGIRVAHIHEPWTEMMGYPGTLWYPEQVTAAMQAARAHGVRFALYSQHTISSLAPEFAEWGNEFSLTVPMKAAFNRVPAQTIYFTCKGSAWADFYVWNWVRMIKEYGVTGIYLDGTFHPSTCENPYHDHVPRGPEGSVRPTMGIRAVRAFAKRMLRATREVDPGFYYLGHGNYPFTAHFMDYTMTGENFWLAPPNAEVPLDTMRVVLGRQWSVPMEFYRGPVMTTRYMMPIALAHGIAVWTSGIYDGSETDQLHAPIWRIWEAFGIEEAEFVGYWRNSPLVTSSHPDVVASFHRKPGNVLLAAATAKRDPPEATITVDLNGLGLAPATLTVTAGDRRKALDVTADADGKLRLQFPRQTNAGYYVWLSDGK